MPGKMMDNGNISAWFYQYVSFFEPNIHENTQRQNQESYDNKLNERTDRVPQKSMV